MKVLASLLLNKNSTMIILFSLMYHDNFCPPLNQAL